MTDKITVISQTTQERNKKLKQLYEDCLPLLREGKSLPQSVMKVKNIKHRTFTKNRWYRDLLHYAKEHGYNGY